MALEFSDAGRLKSFEAGSTATVAAAAESLKSTSTAISSGLEQAATIASKVGALRDTDFDRRLAKLKKEVELKQTQLTAAGLQATAQDHAELQRLKQQVDLADQRAKLDPAALDAAAIRREVELINAQKDESVARRQLQAETELAELRLEVERLKTEWEKDHPGGK